MERGHARAQSDQIIYHNPHYVAAGSYPNSHFNAATTPYGHAFNEESRHGRSRTHSITTNGSAFVDTDGPRAWSSLVTKEHPSSSTSSTASSSASARQPHPSTLTPASALLNFGIASNSSSTTTTGQLQAYDESRRRSLGAPRQSFHTARSHSQYSTDSVCKAPWNAPFNQALYHQRAMPPPPSPPQQQPLPLQSTTSSRSTGASAISPYDGARDSANNTTTSSSSSFSPAARRHGAGMSISSMLGNADDRIPPTSPHSATNHPSSTSHTLRPPSPARARSRSMREPYSRGFHESSPGRTLVTGSDSYAGAGRYDPLRLKRSRENSFGSPKQAHDTANGFRSFFPTSQPEARPYSAAAGADAAAAVNGNRLPGRPSSQPSAQLSSLYNGTSSHSDDRNAGEVGVFRTFGGGQRGARVSQDLGNGSHSHDGSERTAGFRDHADYSAVERDSNSVLPARDEQTTRFRSAYNPLPPPQPQPDSYQPRESIESRSFIFEPRRESGRITPPSVAYATEQYRNGSHDRPLTYEEHQRMEALSREYGGVRKDSDGYTHRSIMNISPEMARRGRDSPLPQAVQGARSRHIGPGGDHPGIKSEFGRMFSGLGSGVGSATPVAGHSANGNTTPSRILSPTAGDLRAAYDGENGRSASVASKLGRKHARKIRDRSPELYDGRMTPSLSARGGKRVKTAHPLHHHHHHHHHAHHHFHDTVEPSAGSYSMIRFPSNSGSQPPQSTHWHHHHHHGVHAHPVHHHHHHHAQHASPIKKPTVTVNSDSVVKAVADKSRKQLGSMPYSNTRSIPLAKASSRITPSTNATPVLPRFEGKENCLFTVRVPKWIISRTSEQVEAGDPSQLEEICRRRHIWGSDVYTDDSDVIAAAVHSGWIRGDFGDANDVLQVIDDEDAEPSQNGESKQLTFPAKPTQPVHIRLGYDMHITVLILPPLEAYTGTHQHHVSSRDWKNGAPHDGMSFMIYRIEFVMEGNADRGVGRDAKSRKARIAMEEQKRREATAALSKLPDPTTVQVAVNGTLSVST